MYQQTLQEFGHKVLPAWHPQVKMVQRVLDRLIPQAGLRDQEWEVHVIDDKSQLNAFVLPGYATISSGTDVVWWSPARR